MGCMGNLLMVAAQLYMLYWRPATYRVHCAHISFRSQTFGYTANILVGALSGTRWSENTRNVPRELRHLAVKFIGGDVCKLWLPWANKYFRVCSRAVYVCVEFWCACLSFLLVWRWRAKHIYKWVLGCVWDYVKSSGVRLGAGQTDRKHEHVSLMWI